MIFSPTKEQLKFYFGFVRKSAYYHNFHVESIFIDANRDSTDFHSMVSLASGRSHCIYHSGWRNIHLYSIVIVITYTSDKETNLTIQLLIKTFAPESILKTP